MSPSPWCVMAGSTPLTVVYSPLAVADAASFSPSASKPAAVIADWTAHGLPLRVVPPEAASVEELALAHDRAYVEDILAGRRANGFGNVRADVAASLPFTTGALLTAARLALADGGAVCAPVSGFHHAGWNDACGFCTFNGLVVTARSLWEAGLVRRTAILDCDQHYGDGTDAILARLDGPAWLYHFTAGREYERPSQVPAFFERLAREIDAVSACDLVLYQAGADPHVDDPLGGWLTTEQLRTRDAFVFEGLRARGVPVVWNLAGGYQRDASGGIAPVLEIHRNTAHEHLRVFGQSKEAGARAADGARP